MIEIIKDETARQEIQIAADDILKLRKVDVDRVLMASTKPIALAVWISTRRQDLEAECRDVLNEEGLLERTEFNVPTLIERQLNACQGCGSEPGDGYTDGCNDPEGCGFFRDEEGAPRDPEMEAHYGAQMEAHLTGSVSPDECPICESEEPDTSEASSPAGWPEAAPEPTTVAPHGSAVTPEFTRFERLGEKLTVVADGHVDLDADEPQKFQTARAFEVVKNDMAKRKTGHAHIVDVTNAGTELYLFLSNGVRLTATVTDIRPIN